MKALGDLSLTELNDLLPVGWQATLTDLSKKGELDNALIQALGVDFGTFYRLKNENAVFNAVLTECELLRLGFWQGVQRAMIFGDLSPKASGLLIRILEKLERKFDMAVDRIFDVEKVDKQKLLDSATIEELRAYADFLKADAYGLDSLDDSDNQASDFDVLSAQILDESDNLEKATEPESDNLEKATEPKSAAQALRWRLERKQ